MMKNPLPVIQKFFLFRWGRPGLFLAADSKFVSESRITPVGRFVGKDPVVGIS